MKAVPILNNTSLNNMNRSSDKRRGGAAPPSPNSQSQQALADIPAMFKVLQKQNAQMQQLMKEQTAVMKEQVAATQNQTLLLDRVHDRLDSIYVESRVTNLLLSEMVAIHQTMIHDDDLDEHRESVRTHAYQKIFNAE